MMRLLIEKESFAVNTRELAACLQITERRVQQLTRMGIFSPIKDFHDKYKSRIYDLGYAVICYKDYMECTRSGFHDFPTGPVIYDDTFKVKSILGESDILRDLYHYVDSDQEVPAEPDLGESEALSGSLLPDLGKTKSNTKKVTTTKSKAIKATTSRKRKEI